MERVHASQVSLAQDGFYHCDGRPFTGMAVTQFPDGSPRSEAEYRNGLRWGASKTCHKNGTPAAAAEFFRDVLHGVAREWTIDGQCVSEIVESRFTNGNGTRAECFWRNIDSPKALPITRNCRRPVFSRSIQALYDRSGRFPAIDNKPNITSIIGR